MKSPTKPASPPITPEQLRQARVALDWSLERLAARSDTTSLIVSEYERSGRVASRRGQHPDFDALASIRTALEAAGIEFMDGDEPGVRLRKSAKAGMTHPPQLTPQQVLAARKLLKWPQERLAAQSGTTTPFVWTYEKEGRVMKMFSRDRSLDGLAAIRSTLEAAGVEFIEQNEGGLGVRLANGNG